MKPIILHGHIPKTAGTSVGELFQFNFGSNHLQHWVPDSLYCLSQTDIEAILDRQPNLMVISSHNLRFFGREVRGRRTLPITFLRKPTAVVISLLRYIKQNFNRLPEPVTRPWPENTPELELRELADRYLAHFQRSGWLRPQTHPSGQLCPLTRFFCPLNYTRPFSLRDSRLFGHNSFSIASRVLKQFFFIGLVEEMELSVRLLRAKLTPFGINLTIPGQIWANQTKDEDISWLKETDPVGRRLLDANRNDQRLYRRFAKSFQADCELWCGKNSVSNSSAPASMQ
jgi:hypothetical protein